ncbi:hypothetical protein KY347_03495 [Candidatus Woesearchaeota archaeon]|nr:hypothetical protein [Candidatus Woesearchaeota archaeon]
MENQAMSKECIISTFNSFNNDEKIELLNSMISTLREKPSKDYIPVGIFDNDKLSIFEALVKYTRENLKFRFVKTASLLNRSDKTIWATYKKAQRKMSLPFDSVHSEIKIPITSFSDRNFTIFESLVFHLKEMDLTNHEIAVMLHRDDRTIWSVYDRAKRKKWAKK